jgi:hypothetical protein
MWMLLVTVHQYFVEEGAMARKLQQRAPPHRSNPRWAVDVIKTRRTPNK